jgi:hypothetical protein
MNTLDSTNTLDAENKSESLSLNRNKLSSSISDLSIQDLEDINGGVSYATGITLTKKLAFTTSLLRTTTPYTGTV